MLVSHSKVCRNSGYKALKQLCKRAMSTDEVLIKKLDKKVVFTLNRPKALNALNLSMIRSMYPKLKEFESDPDIKLIIQKGTGEKAFCAGGDVVAVTESGKAGTSICHDFFREEYKLNYLIGTYTVPFVSIIDGICMGGGVGLSVHGMYRVATDRTMFAMPETAIGLFPDVGGSYFLPRLRHNIGLFLALTGHRLKGTEVYHAGIATHFVHNEHVPDLVEKLENMTGAITADTVGQVLQEFQDKSGDLGHFSMEKEEEKINSYFGADSVEKIFERLQKDDSDFAKQHLKMLEKMSPTSMKVTFRQLHEGSKMDFKDVFTMEYRLSQRFVEDKKDFYEGIRAVLIDKTGDPKWNPQSLEGVTKEKLDWYFSPLPQDRELFLG